MKIYKQWSNFEKKSLYPSNTIDQNSSRITKRSSCAFSHFSQSHEREDIVYVTFSNVQKGFG